MYIHSLLFRIKNEKTHGSKTWHVTGGVETVQTTVYCYISSDDSKWKMNCTYIFSCTFMVLKALSIIELDANILAKVEEEDAAAAADEG